jgi:DNA invertase Pin-like site-specific DNA recombinase
MTKPTGAAIYARRSTEQAAKGEDRSVARQEAMAREFAAERGWTVRAEHVYVDDGISGAEFGGKRPGLKALRAAAARGEFRRVIVSEQKSLGRESFGVGTLIKELAQNGIEVWGYMEARSLTPKNAMDKAMSSLRSFGDEAHREDTSRRNHEAATSKHARGHVAGGRVFGYRNEHVYSGTDAHGNPVKSHTERVVDRVQAATVVRIFEMYAAGTGLKGIARQLTDEGVTGPIPFVRKDGSGLAPFKGWAPATVRAILGREDYRGVYVWNRTRKRDEAFGYIRQRPRPESEWKRTAKPEWRIVSDDLWNQVAARRRDVESASVRLSNGKLSGRPRGEAMHLLSSLATCSVCGGGLVVETYYTSKGKPRKAHYVCNRRRANGKCANSLRVPIEDMHEAVLCAIEEHALTPEAIEAVILASRQEGSAAVERSLKHELAELEKRIARLTDALAAGGELASLVAKLREFETKKTALIDEMAAKGPVPMPPRSVIEDHLAEWRRLLRQSAKTGRVVLDRVLNGRIVFTPVWSHDAEPKPVAYEFECPTRYDKLFSGLVIPAAVMAVRVPGAEDLRYEHIYYRAEDGSVDFGEILRRVFERGNLTEVSSPTGFEPVFWP